MIYGLLYININLLNSWKKYLIITYSLNLADGEKCIIDVNDSSD